MDDGEEFDASALAEQLNLDFITKRVVDTQVVQIGHNQIIYGLEHDARLFIEFFLGDELEYPVPEFHIETWDLLVSSAVLYVALALPRGHAKTTLAKLACVWYILFSDLAYIVAVSSTWEKAREFVKDVVGFLETPNFKAVFGDIEFKVQQEGVGFYVFDVYLPHRESNGYTPVKTIILQSRGARQKVRGLNIRNLRPELAVVDDLEDDDNSATEALRRHMVKWFFGAFLKAMSRKRHKVIFLGNMIRSNGLLNMLVDKLDNWYSQRVGALIKNEHGNLVPLWPELWPMKALQEDFRQYQASGQTGTWFAEMMNQPIPDAGLLINAEDINYAPAMYPGEEELAFITLDPAATKNSWSDQSSLVVHVLRNGIWHIPEHITGKFDYYELFLHMLELCQRWKIHIVGIEAISFQRVLQTLFRIYAATARYDIEFVGIITSAQTKTARLRAWCALLKSGDYSIADTDIAITHQLLNYDPGREKNDDDLIDSCAMGPMMVQDYLDMIIQYYDPSNTSSETPDNARGINHMNV